MSVADLTDQSQTRTKEYQGPAHDKKSVIGGMIGNIMEWYDFALYGFFAPVISQLFFPSDNHFTSLIATFGVALPFFACRSS